MDKIYCQEFKLFNAKLLLSGSLALACLAGCGGVPKPADYGSNWKPVHAYAAQVGKRPLFASHVYKASPSDTSLRGLLTRWSREAGASLVYTSGYDFDLVAQVGAIQSTSLEDALKELQSIYAPHAVEISWKRNALVITVRDLPAVNNASAKRGNFTTKSK